MSAFDVLIGTGIGVWFMGVAILVGITLRRGLKTGVLVKGYLLTQGKWSLSKSPTQFKVMWTILAVLSSGLFALGAYFFSKTLAIAFEYRG